MYSLNVGFLFEGNWSFLIQFRIYETTRVSHIPHLEEFGLDKKEKEKARF